MSLSGSKATDQAIAGFTAGAVSTLVLHPLDLLKTKLQVDESKNISAKLRKILPQIIKQDGILGLYRGLSPNFVGATASWGLYFYWYSHLKDFYHSSNKKDSKLSATQHLTASAAAGALTALITNPIWVVKTRMFTQHSDQVYHDGLKTIYKNEGLKGYYRGIIPALFGTSHGALQFMAYEQLKIFHGDNGKKLGTLQYITMASAAKIFATICTYPYQVVKSRMQTESKLLQNEYNTVSSTIMAVLKNEGGQGFYKGMGINILRVLPGTCITFAVYEAMTTFTSQN